MPVNAVVDLSHHNTTVDLVAAKAAGLLGVIHKATQGVNFQDPLYAQRLQQANDNGLLWGAYHFGDGSDGVAQAQYFLDTIGDPTNQLLVLDFESNPAGPSMTIEDARAFVTYIFEMTGEWPGFYCGGDFKRIVGNTVDRVIGNCWLWLAQYSNTPIVPVTWQKWTMWQYTDGENGPMPHAINGIGPCDRDQFNGTAADLVAFWDEFSPSPDVEDFLTSV